MIRGDEVSYYGSNKASEAFPRKEEAAMIPLVTTFCRCLSCL